jgi:uncharacterized membrane-anchored protein
MSTTLWAAEDRPRIGRLSKVPTITAYFWIIKILTTAMGEAASDYGVHRNALVAVALGAAGFGIALIIQFSVKRYIAWSYWLLVAMVSVFGTMAADIIHKAGVAHYLTTVIFGTVLLSVFALWYKTENTLSVHSICTPSRESFYWITVFVSFAFGTAAGDWTAGTLHLGNFRSGLLFAVLFVLPAIGYWKFKLNGIFAFWFSYVMTRPLGASFADWFGKPVSHGGLAYGTGSVCVVLTVFIVLFVSYLTITRQDDGSSHLHARSGR